MHLGLIRREPVQSSGEAGLSGLEPEDIDLDLGHLRRCERGPVPNSLLWRIQPVWNIDRILLQKKEKNQDVGLKGWPQV